VGAGAGAAGAGAGAAGAQPVGTKEAMKPVLLEQVVASATLLTENIHQNGGSFFLSKLLQHKQPSPFIPYHQPQKRRKKKKKSSTLRDSDKHVKTQLHLIIEGCILFGPVRVPVEAWVDVYQIHFFIYCLFFLGRRGADFHSRNSSQEVCHARIQQIGKGLYTNQGGYYWLPTLFFYTQ
jgi:hypothetical protein